MLLIVAGGGIPGVQVVRGWAFLCMRFFGVRSGFVTSEANKAFVIIYFKNGRSQFGAI
jgi:hypothetical protein